ncbi:MAG TPA: aconitase family protein, partial [Ignavibacteria bacterium]
MDVIEKISKTLSTPLGQFRYFCLGELCNDGYKIEEFPFSIRILLENVIRNFNNSSFNKTHLDNILNWNPKQTHKEIPYLPARVLMQDFTGIPSIVDIVSIRSEVARKNKNPKLINPQVPVDLIIDHSVQVDFYGTNYAYQ